jgi:Na+/melibiose symporter-like transporter
MVYPAFFVALVPPASYLDANSKLSTSVSSSYVAGPAIGGALVQALTAPVAVAFDAVSFLFSAAVVSRIRVADTPAAADAGEPMRKRIAAGFRFIAHQPILRASLACSAMMNFFMFVAQALIILFANRTLGLPAGVIGLAFGAGAAGGLLIAVFARRIAGAIGVGRSIVLGAVLYPAPIALLALARGPHWAEALFLGGTELLSSAGTMLFDINHNSLRAAVTPDATRSRAAGAYAVVNYGSRPVGALVGGLLGTTIGLRPTLFVAAVGGTLGALWLLLSPIPGTATIPVPPPQA